MNTASSIIIAIDGTAASGKGTLARKLAERLGYGYLDTGLLYRRVALSLIDRGQSCEDAEAAIAAARALDPATLDDPRLRGAEAGRGASVVGAIPDVRLALETFQRDFPRVCGKPGAVIDGRDIGTVIFPDAPVKFYIDAALETRAARRWKELQAKGDDIALETVIADFKVRDARDGGRAFRPMKAADDAITIDSTHMNADEVVAVALTHLEKYGLDTARSGQLL